MRDLILLLVVGSTLLGGMAQARTLSDGYPYDRESSGCVKGDCENGVGVYVYTNDDIYAGSWREGERHGWGTYYFVDEESWSTVHKIIGNWVEGKQHGRLAYVLPDGETRHQYWYHGDEVSSRVEKCRDAQALSSAYKGFVAILNGLVAAANGENALEGAARGYDAADKQIVPRAIDLSCDQLLAEFD